MNRVDELRSDPEYMEKINDHHRPKLKDAQPEKKGAPMMDPSAPVNLDLFLKKEIPPIEFYIDEFFPKRMKTMISAGTNKGKSIFIQNAALAMASGCEFLNRKVTGKARVLYLDLEMGPSALQERFKVMADRNDLDIENLLVKHVPDLNLLDELHQRQLEEWITEEAIDLVILDPLGSCWQGDENNKQEVQGVTSYINTLIAKKDVGVIVVHHWRKATDKNRSGGEMAAGSYLWTAWLDEHITLDGEIHSLTVSCEKARHGSRFRPFIMKLNPETLWFDFIAEYKQAMTPDIILSLMEQAGKTEMLQKDLIEFSITHNGPKQAKARELIRAGEGKYFEVVDLGEKNKKLIKLKQSSQKSGICGQDGEEWPE